MADTLHLTCRKGVWYYRRRVPEHLVAAIGCKVVQFSLGTKGKPDAKKLRAIQDMGWDARFEASEAALHEPEAAPNSASLSSHQAEEMLRDYVERMHRRFEESLLADPPSDQDELRDMQVDAEVGLGILRDPADPRREELIDSVIDEIMNGSQGGVEDEPAFAHLVWRGLLELSRRKLARYGNEFGRTFFDEAFEPGRGACVTFGELAEQYLAQEIEEAALNGAAKKWTDKVHANVALVREIIGDGTPVASVDYDRCRHAASLLSRTPANRTKSYPKLSLEKAIESAEAQGRPLLSVTTQAQYLRTLKEVLELGALKGIIPNNPAQSIRPLKRDRTADGDKRRPFSLDQIKAIFTSDFYRTCAPGAALPYTKLDRDWRFWLPLICLFMGMRPNEVCQLAVGDVKHTKNGTPYIDVAASGGADEDGASAVKKTLKTATSRRRVPVHPELISIGFLDFVEQRQKTAGGGAALLRGLKPDQHGNLASYPLKRFRDSFLPQVVALGERQSFYSFRHSFRDALRRCDAPPATLQALGGWSQGKLTSDSYGDQFDPDYQRQWIERVSFPGLDLGFLRQQQDEAVELSKP